MVRISRGLMGSDILLVLSFLDSSSLTSAYGIAVTGARLIETVLLTVLIFRLWKWHPFWAGLLLSIFYIVDGAYFAANMTKIPDGGWFPLLVGLVIFTLLTTWAKGRQLMLDRMREAAMPIPVFEIGRAHV